MRLLLLQSGQSYVLAQEAALVESLLECVGVRRAGDFVELVGLTLHLIQELILAIRVRNVHIERVSFVRGEQRCKIPTNSDTFQLRGDFGELAICRPLGLLVGHLTLNFRNDVVQLVLEFVFVVDNSM